MNLSMVRIGVLLTAISFALQSTAQISITSSQMPIAGDTLRYSSAELTPPIDLTTTGPNQAWNFSSLVPTRQGLYEYKRANQISLVYSGFFGPSAFGRIIFDSIGVAAFKLYDFTAFYSTNSSRFRAEGAGVEYLGVPIPANYSDEDEVYQFPLNYLDRDSSTFELNFQLSTLLRYVQKGYRINQVDGWGTITTPYGTQACLRVKSTIVRTDSISLNGVGLPSVRSTQEEYKWLSLAERAPMLEVIGTRVLNSFVVSSIRYRDTYRRCLAIPPSAGFSANVTAASTADTIQLTSSAECANIISWAITPVLGVSYAGGTNFLSANPRVRFANTGLYTVSQVVTNGLGIDTLIRTNYISISPSTGAEADAVSGANTAWQLLPNPVQNSVTILGNLRAERLRMYSTQGQCVLDAPFAGPQHTYDLSGLAPGVYVVSLGGTTQRLVKR